MKETFCVECGKESGDALVDGVCASCFLAKVALTRLPPYVDFEACSHCHARRRGETWLEGTQSLEPLVREAALEALEVDRRVTGFSARVEVVAEDERNFGVVVASEGSVESVRFSESRTARARVKSATCPRCSRIHGGYYEGIVQIRAEGRDLEPDELRGVRGIASRMIDRIVAEGDRNAFVLKDVEEHGGLDIYVGTTGSGRSIGKTIAADLGGRMREHPKIAGREDGRDVYRVTFAIRLPHYRRGDFAVLRGAVHVVQAIRAKDVTLRDVTTGQPLTLERDELEKLPIFRAREAREAVVVSQTAGEMQLLDPWTYATRTVLKPAGLGVAPETVPVLRWEGEIVVVPLAKE